MKAAIYARVSTKAQDDAIQLAELEGFAQRWNWQAGVYEDKLTGKEGSVKDFCENIAVLDQAGVRFIVPQQNIDTDKSSPVGRFTIHILAAVAELERSFIVGAHHGGAAGVSGRLGGGAPRHSRRT